MATMIDIAEAVKDELNTGQFSQSFTAVRAYQPTYDLKDMATLRVTVVPQGLSQSMVSRGQYQFEYVVDVGVMKKVADDSDCDSLMTLVEEIGDHFAGLAVEGAVCVDVSNEPIFDPDHLLQQRQFTSVLHLTFRVLR